MEPLRLPALRRTRTQSTDRRSAGRYEGALRHIIHAFKYEGRRTLGMRLGAMMRDAGGEMLSDADCVVPVPLHPWRRLTRGFNQAADLAACLDRPIVHALWRTRATVPQTGLTADERRAQRARRLLDVPAAVASRASRRCWKVASSCWLTMCGRPVRRWMRVLRFSRQAGVREVRALTVALAE